MKFQDDISNMNTYVRTYIHTDKPKPICPPPHFFKVGGIKNRKIGALGSLYLVITGDYLIKSSIKIYVVCKHYKQGDAQFFTDNLNADDDDNKDGNEYQN